MSRLLPQYFKDLSPLSKSVPQRNDHQYTEQMSRKSEVVVLDVLMKSEARSSDMVDIMQTLQGYLGDDYPSIRRIASGGDQLTCEHQVGVQRHLMDGDKPRDRLQLLEPQLKTRTASSAYLFKPYITVRVSHEGVHYTPQSHITYTCKYVHILECECEYVVILSLNHSHTKERGNSYSGLTFTVSCR